MGDQDETSIYVFDLGVIPGADLIFKKVLKSFQEKSGWSESENTESRDLNHIQHFSNKQLSAELYIDNTGLGYIAIAGKRRDSFSSSFKEIEKLSKKVKTNSSPVLTSVLSSPKQLRHVPAGMSVSKELSILINTETERFYVKTCQGKIRPDVEADIESQKARVGRFKVSPLFNEKDSASLEESDKYLSAAQEYVAATFSDSDSLTLKAGILAIDLASIATVAQLLFSLWDTLFSHWGTTKSSASTLRDYAVVAFVILLFLVFLFVLNWPRKKKNS